MSIDKTASNHPQHYDVFISYSHKDLAWVQSELLPRLEKAGLKVIIDFRDFEIGVASIINMERAVEHARHTLVVLTPNWINSEWTEFESLLVGTRDPAGRRRRLIPLMLQQCDMPARLAMLTYLDMTDSTMLDQQMTRLIKSLQPAQDRVGTSEQTHLSPANPNAEYAPNPFGMTGRITNPAHFFGREDLLRQIFEELGKGVNLSLVGESRIGKSSLLSMICTQGPERLKLPSASFAYLNLQGVETEDEFYDVLCEALSLETCRGIKLSRTLRGQRRVLCLDEIEIMAWEGFTVRVRSQLRGLADGPEAPLKLVIASRSPLAHLFPDSPELDSPLAGICLQLDVGPFRPETARAFLAERLRGTGITFSEEQINTLLATSGGHPAKLQRAAADLYRRLAKPSK